MQDLFDDDDLFIEEPSPKPEPRPPIVNDGRTTTG